VQKWFLKCYRLNKQNFERKSVLTFCNALGRNRICCISVITCNATLIFTYDTETKQQSMHWISPNSANKKKIKSFYVSFEIQDHTDWFLRYPGCWMAEWVPTGQTINHQYYIEILTKFAWKIEKETARILEYRVDFPSGQRSIPYRFVRPADFSQ
jgi:hypothetical protein